MFSVLQRLQRLVPDLQLAGSAC